MKVISRYIYFLTVGLTPVMCVFGCVTDKINKNQTSVVRDLIYAERTSVQLKADWHPPNMDGHNAGSNMPACIVIHGGGWFKGDKKDMESISARLAGAGIAALNIKYRLAPEYRFPAPVIDTKDAIRWIKGNSDRLGVDPKRICLIGYSAGAHLALMAGFTQPSDGLDDTTPSGAKIFRFPEGDVMPTLPHELGVKAIAAGGTPVDLTDGSYNKYYEKFFGKPPTEIPQTYKAASPITYVRKGLPPVFLYHGKNDWIVEVEQSRRLVDKLRSVGVDVEYLEVTFGHVATFLFDDKEVGAAINFLKARL